MKKLQKPSYVNPTRTLLAYFYKILTPLMNKICTKYLNVISKISYQIKKKSDEK